MKEVEERESLSRSRLCSYLLAQCLVLLVIVSTEIKVHVPGVIVDKEYYYLPLVNHR